MSSLKEVLGSIRRGKTGLRTCPQCGSSVQRSRAPLEGWILPVKYVCKNCGYSGFIALEEVGEARSDD